MKNNSLFSDFDPVLAKQWKQKIQMDLRGADYNDTLIWESLEGIKVKPFYNHEDVEANSNFQFTGEHTWQIGQIVYGGNPNLANKKALDILKRGAGSLVFEISSADIDWSVLLDGIPLESVPIHLDFHTMEIGALERLQKYLGDRTSKIYLHLDIIGHLAKSGNWYQNLEKDHQAFDQIQTLTATTKGISAISVDMSLYQNAGANIVQQLAYGLAHANEYLNHSKDVISNVTKEGITFKVAIGPNYFFEIAKLKALRWLWKSLAPEYGIETDCHILAIPSKRNKALYDYNVNMLRTTSECMSAVLGGANTVCNQSYDALYHKDNEFGERIARNQLLLLKEESYFDEAIKASEGSYYIEALTQELAEKALALFKQLEASGGFLGELKKGIIQKKIKEAAAKEQEQFDAGKLVLLGTNKYQNPEDKMKDSLELFPFLKTDKRKTLVEPILEKRLSESLEQNRLKDE